MKVKLSKYVADYLVEYGITDVFTVTGGGAMHLNDAFGHHPGLKCTYFHHEQAAAMAAECYARIHNRIAALCVTTGPGGTNALTGVLGGYLDSIPMLVISGQVRYDTTARSTGLQLRAMGDQEFDIIKAVSCMTKYSTMVIQSSDIRKVLQKALSSATNGRPGPCWIDIPVDIQSAMVETEELPEWAGELSEKQYPPISESLIWEIYSRLEKAKRPVINAGNGIRLSGSVEVFRKLVNTLQIPVVTGYNSFDLIEEGHPLYCGRTGNLGNRAGNFAIQNSDLVLSIGSRLSLRQVSYNYTSWAKNAYTIVVDIDPEELKKPTLHVDIPVCSDAKLFMEKLLNAIPGTDLPFKGESWREQCRHWKKTYPVVDMKKIIPRPNTNPYVFIHELSKSLPSDSITVSSNGTACIVTSQAFEIRQGMRCIKNSAIASMGYGLPAAIGACKAASTEQEIVCIEGDGSLQMNIQELQTIVQYKLPIKLFVLNNSGYHSIRQTQNNFFDPPLVGIGEDSGDLSFPNLSKIAEAYGIPYCKCATTQEISQSLKQVQNMTGAVICEVFLGNDYEFAPKSTATRLADGTMVSAPLEDLYPFLPRAELAANMLGGECDAGK